MTSINIKGIAFPSREEALRRETTSVAAAAIAVGGQFLVVRLAEMDRLSELGVPFAFLSLNGAAVYMDGVARGATASEPAPSGDGLVTVSIT